MFNKLGFIGAGNMALAMIKALLDFGISGDRIFAYDVDAARLSRVVKETGINVCATAFDAVLLSDLTFIAVKPDKVSGVIADINAYAAGKHFVSIAAGITASSLIKAFNKEARVARVMPNTPALVGEGMMVISGMSTFTQQALTQLSQLLSCMGSAKIVEDKHMDAVTGLSGSGPAFVFLFIEALADGAVAEGLPRDTAYTLAAQMVLGAARMVLDTGEHPGRLKDGVCSPGGTTIEGVLQLERDAFRGAAANAVQAAVKKARQMSE